MQEAGGAHAEDDCPDEVAVEDVAFDGEGEERRTEGGGDRQWKGHRHLAHALQKS